MDNTKRKEGEEGTAEIIPPPMSRTRSERRREENNKRLLIQAKNNRRALVGGFNENVEQNEKEASSNNKVTERAEPSEDRAKGNCVSSSVVFKRSVIRTNAYLRGARYALRR